MKYKVLAAYEMEVEARNREVAVQVVKDHVPTISGFGSDGTHSYSYKTTDFFQTVSVEELKPAKKVLHVTQALRKLARKNK